MNRYVKKFAKRVVRQALKVWRHDAVFRSEAEQAGLLTTLQRYGALDSLVPFGACGMVMAAELAAEQEQRWKKAKLRRARRKLQSSRRRNIDILPRTGGQRRAEQKKRTRVQKLGPNIVDRHQQVVLLSGRYASLENAMECGVPPVYKATQFTVHVGQWENGCLINGYELRIVCRMRDDMPIFKVKSVRASCGECLGWNTAVARRRCDLPFGLQQQLAVWQLRLAITATPVAASG